MRLTSKQYGIILFALATAFLHLFLFIRLGPDPIALNGLGYLGLLGAYFLPVPFFQENRRRVRWALFGYTAIWISHHQNQTCLLMSSVLWLMVKTMLGGFLK